MTDPIIWSMISAASLAGVVVVTVATLKGWRDWIGLQRLSFEGRGAATIEATGGVPSSAARIELADLRERVRKLEAIAAGVDL
jgi:hypothetical protein